MSASDREEILLRNSVRVGKPRLAIVRRDNSRRNHDLENYGETRDKRRKVTSATHKPCWPSMAWPPLSRNGR